MMIKEPPQIDRERLCREKEARLRLQARVQQALDLLAPDECLGEPYREEYLVILPVEQVEAAREDTASLHALAAAWLDDG